MLSFPPSLRWRAFLAALAVTPAMTSAAAQGVGADAARDTLRLSVDDAVAIALRQSDEVGVAAAQVDVADAQFGAARASALPQLRFNAAYLHTYQSARGQAVGAQFNQPNSYTANANLAQTLFQGGKILSTTRAANELRDAARYDEREVRANVALLVQRSYLQALFTDRIAELQQRNLALAASRVTQVEQFERAGQAARYDVLRARVERANIEPLAIQAQNDRELALLDLKRVLNLPIERPIALVSHISSAAAMAMVAALDDTITVSERAAIRSAELNLAARQLGVRVARADYYPTLTAFYQSGFQAFPPPGQGFPTTRGNVDPVNCPVGSASTLRCQNGGFFSDQQAGINVSFPLFDGFRVKSNVDLAKAQTRLAELQLRQQREAVSLEVARARAELRRSRTVFEASQQNSAEAEEAFRLASLRFARGLSTQLEVSDAQLALLTAQSTEARATYDLFLASADLARALGRPIPLPAATGVSPNPR